MSTFTVEVKGLDSLAARLNPTTTLDKMREAMLRGLILVQTSTVRKLSGPVLHNVTGTLRRSIHFRTEQSDTALKGLVGSFAGYPNPRGGEQAAGYARINEFGGTFTVPEHERRVTQIFGREVEPFIQTVRAHTATYPERSFLRSSLRDEKKNIVKEFRLSMNEALSGA